MIKSTIKVFTREDGKIGVWHVDTPDIESAIKEVKSSLGHKHRTAVVALVPPKVEQKELFPWLLNESLRA